MWNKEGIKLTFLGGLPELKCYFECLSYSEGDCLGLKWEWLSSTLVDGVLLCRLTSTWIQPVLCSVHFPTAWLWRGDKILMETATWLYVGHGTHRRHIFSCNRKMEEAGRWLSEASSWQGGREAPLPTTGHTALHASHTWTHFQQTQLLHGCRLVLTHCRASRTRATNTAKGLSTQTARTTLLSQNVPEPGKDVHPSHLSTVQDHMHENALRAAGKRQNAAGQEAVWEAGDLWGLSLSPS